MTGGSLGIRSGSYGSLDKQLQNGVLPIQAPSATRTKPSKMFKEKETLVHWICKFAGRKKVGMLLLCAISAAVFVWVLYVGKGEDQESDNVPKVNDSLPLNNSGSPLINEVQSVRIDNWTSLPVIVEGTEVRVMPPPPPSYFLGYTLPPGHPCATFSLPPPPADKKRTGPRPCPVCYLPVEDAIALMPKVPSFSPVVKNLTYIYEENLNKETEFGGSDFGGYPTLKQRDDSYDIRESMNVHCGFVKGSKPGHGTGFDIDDNDLLEMEKCHGVVVASAIFGAFDIIQQPKNISEYSKQTICFYMFADEETEADLKANRGLGESKKIGVWRIVVVRNLPYTDGRRNGKIPKLLPHRLFPNARFSLWIDGKLELVADPYQILERFLWRKNATFAISRHYKRFDVFDEAEANKAAGKYDNASIDFQVDFYKKEGLTPYSEAKLPITSDVPEGCVIIREHVPISNLFTCLWFNDVDRFTSRDQISFSTVRDKIAAKTNWSVNMFLDCERRNFVVQKHHKEVLAHLAQMSPPTIYPPPSPLSLANDPPRLFSLETSGESIVSTPLRKVSPRRGRDKRSGSRRHRKVVRGTDSS
ncbi:F3H9.11 protein isoform 1 [Theobroma cacao]|uniref:F3H9.11 protein isoform 1 n=1 Tax=Theobroma cacao TaxID=3641 RepID=A0A061GFQ0_THECC|nr:F3H9.11 protein isoform 1 [Theobroma cacao]